MFEISVFLKFTLIYKVIMIVVRMKCLEIIRDKVGKSSLNILTTSCRLLYLRTKFFQKGS